METVSQILENDHRKIESLFEMLKCASAWEQPSLALDLFSELETHLIVEEKTVYCIAEQLVETYAWIELGYAQHNQMRELYAKIDCKQAGHGAWFEQLAHLTTIIDQHMHHEESTLLPALEKLMTIGQLERMATNIKHSKNLASFLGQA